MLSLFTQEFFWFSRLGLSSEIMSISLCSDQFYIINLFCRWSSTDWWSTSNRNQCERSLRSMTEQASSRSSSIRRLSTKTRKHSRTSNTNHKPGSESWELSGFSKRRQPSWEILSSQWYNMTRFPIISFKFLWLIILERRESSTQHNLKPSPVSKIKPAKHPKPPLTTKLRNSWNKLLRKTAWSSFLKTVLWRNREVDSIRDRSTRPSSTFRTMASSSQQWETTCSPSQTNLEEWECYQKLTYGKLQINFSVINLNKRLNDINAVNIPSHFIIIFLIYDLTEFELLL